MKIGVNSFGLGTYLRTDGQKIWQGLLEGGITSIEPCISFACERPQTEAYRAAWEKGVFDGVFQRDAAPAQLAALRKMGFEVFSFQLQETPFTMEGLTEALSFMGKNGLCYCVYSFMDRSVEKIKLLAPTIRSAVKLFRKHGKELLVHNHDMEWLPDGDTSVMRWLLENIPELHFEIDLGWTEYAGVSAAALLRKYPDRFPLLHIKEIAKGKKAWSKTPFCTAPGEGILPLKELLAIAKTMPLQEQALIIDQDDSVSGDIVGDIAKGVKNIHRLCDSL